MKYVLVFPILCAAIVFGWTPRPRVDDHTEFFTAVIQETIYDLEKVGFSTLRMVNVTQNIDMQMHKWHINGTAVYTNGFLISIQKMDVTAMSQAVSTITSGGVTSHRASVSGTLNLRDAKVGYDVYFTPVNGSPQTFYTGDFTHTLLTLAIGIQKNLTTNEITATMTPGVSGGLMRMVYRPTSNITEVLSREFRPFNNYDGVASWSNTLIPLIVETVKNKIPFPTICFSHC
uniref:Lipid-binding serum glycoprotein N-terminal domain-containing protein n=1 Tax=Heliothis virescens TaxID=7102 RepID=A0A2A4JT51_HELVI